MRDVKIGMYELPYAEKDFVNPEVYDYRCWKGREPKAWVFVDHGYVIGIVFPSHYDYSSRDALDEMVDSGRLDRYQIDEAELPDYQVGVDAGGNPVYEVEFLGNAGEPFDVANVETYQVPVAVFATDPLIARIMMENSED